MKKIFGFIFSQPLHITIRQLRLFQLGAMIFSFYLLWDLMEWYMANADLSQGDAAFLAFAGALIGAIWKAISSMNETVDRDYDYEDIHRASSREDQERYEDPRYSREQERRYETTRCDRDKQE